MVPRVLRWRPAVLLDTTGADSGRDRAWVRVTAHAFGLAAVCRVWWVPKFKGGASGGLNSEGVSSRRGWRAAARDGSALLVLLGARRVVCRRSLLVVAQCSGSLAASAPYGSRPVRRRPAGSHVLWSGPVRLDTTGPVSLATPADAARDPEHNTLMVRRIHRTTWSIDAAPCRRPSVYRMRSNVDLCVVVSGSDRRPPVQSAVCKRTAPPARSSNPARSRKKP